MARNNCTRAYVEVSQTRMFRDWLNRASVTSSFFARSSDFLAFVDCWNSQQTHRRTQTQKAKKEDKTIMSPASSSARSSNWLADQISNFHNGHERVKNAVHSYWRQNTILSPKGRFGKVAMSCFYFSLPVVFGYVVVNKVVEGSESTVRERIGDGSFRDTTDSPKIGAGGWGGGVHLVASDRDTQERNRINLERFLKKQRKLKEKRDKDASLTEQ